MGGGGGFDPVSIIGNMVFGSVLGPMVRNSAGGQTGGSGADAAAAEAALQAAEARRRADRKKAETALLAKARQADRANQATQSGQGGQAESLGAPASAPDVAASQLKARLGQ